MKAWLIYHNWKLNEKPDSVLNLQHNDSICNLWKISKIHAPKLLLKLTSQRCGTYVSLCTDFWLYSMGMFGVHVIVHSFRQKQFFFWRANVFFLKQDMVEKMFKKKKLFILSFYINIEL